MMRNALSCLCLSLGILPAACAQKVVAPPPSPPANVISTVTAAKRVFVSNEGADPFFVQDITGGADGGYSAFYASLKKWDYFQLVGSPAQADLVFGIKGTEACHDERVGMTYHTARTCSTAMLNLSIMKPSTPDLVYTIAIPAGRGWNRSKGAIAFSRSIDALTDRVKGLVAAPVVKQNP
jgi:hypothetical protein